MPTPLAHLLVIACATTLSANVATQSATYTYFGSAGTHICAGLTNLSHTATNLPRIGTTFSVELPISQGFSCSYDCTVYLLATGLSNTTFQGVPLPVATPSATAYTCGMLQVSLDMLELVPFGITSTTWQSNLVIPNDTNLVGMSFYQQAIEMRFILGWHYSTSWGIGGHGTIGQ